MWHFCIPESKYLQAGGVSVGRGTATPFELFGAPWIQPADLPAELNRRKVARREICWRRFSRLTLGFTRASVVPGLSIALTDRAALQSMLMGLEIAEAFSQLYPREFQLEKMIELLGSQCDDASSLSAAWMPARKLSRSWRGDLDKFRAMREKYLLYH